MISGGKQLEKSFKYTYADTLQEMSLNCLPADMGYRKRIFAWLSRSNCRYSFTSWLAEVNINASYCIIFCLLEIAMSHFHEQQA